MRAPQGAETVAEGVAEGVRRIVAPNPSPFTHRGTNTYLVGSGPELAVIDPGPDDPGHLAAILAAAGRARITAILVSHAHRDHTALAGALAAATGAPVLAFGDAGAGRDPVAAALGDLGDLGGGEGVDADFRPEARLDDGESIGGAGWRLVALHTPGHMGNHLCLALGDTLFSGDHAMGWATSIVSPPDGEMGAYMRTLDRLIARRPARLLPGHGDPVAEGLARLVALRDHRRAREAQILAALAAGPADAAGLAARIYAGLAPGLLPAAARNVLAHLLDLLARGRLRAEGPLAADAVFARTA
jgi:glyoxylase-like metal-dependent hydrolase (beta-lactamase superfamily II)